MMVQNLALKRATRYVDFSPHSQTYCTAAFLDITQALDKVCHQVLLSQLHAIFPANV
jgi:hypothetical protein